MNRVSKRKKKESSRGETKWVSALERSVSWSVDLAESGNRVKKVTGKLGKSLEMDSAKKMVDG